MPFLGVTANVMSLFGFIIVLGVVVDDAIVTGENVFSKLQSGINPLEASIIGTKEEKPDSSIQDPKPNTNDHIF